MAKRNLEKLVLSSVVAGMVGYSLPSYADDTEVYFSSIAASIKANVLFIIDVSGSMNFNLDNNSVASGKGRETARMATIKDSLDKILADQNTQKLRMGLMSFAEQRYTYLRQPIVDIDEIDTDKDIKKTVSGTQTTLEQTVLTDSDDGWQQSNTSYYPDYGPTQSTWVTNKTMEDTQAWYENSGDAQIISDFVTLRGTAIYPRHVAFRFNNILLKNPSSVSLTKSSISKAVFKYYGNAGPQSAPDVEVLISVDRAVNSPYLRPELEANISSRTTSATVNCQLADPMTVTGNGAWQDCDITKLVQDQVGEEAWQDGNAITVIMQSPSNTGRWTTVFFKEAGYPAKLEITADNALIAENKKLKKEKILDAAMALYPQGSTAIVTSLYKASGYISNLAASGSSEAGPFHSPEYASIPSPITEKCQLSHVVLMTDGAPSADSVSYKVAPYISQAVNNCQIFTGNDKSASIMDPGTGSYGCGRALVSWMARTSHSNYEGGDGNYIRTQTIGFALNDVNGIKFLKDMSDYGQGKYYDANDVTSLVKAFQSIIENALGAARPSASGVVAMGAQSSYDQRPEVFYGLYKTSSYDYWSGNVKGFRIAFDNYKLSDGTDSQRAVLKDWSGVNYVIASDGTFIENFSSAWSTKDSGDVTKGGVVENLDAAAVRKVYTLKADKGPLNSGAAIALDSSVSSISTADLGLSGADNTESRRKGLLDFIHGYDYIADGVTSGKAKVANPKIGESANNAVSLLSYGKCKDKDVLDCNFDTLQMVGFYATNDGFFRGYDLTNGKALFEFIPQQMLPVISNLEKTKGLNRREVKTYGLDSRVVISHDDVNKNGIVDGEEKAYAIVASGRGGPFIYGINITKQSAPELMWVINNTGSFSHLGNAWSVPVAGTIKVGSELKPVIVFGGGYDVKQDGDENYDGTANFPQTQDTVGNALYVVNAQTGDLLWSTSAGMQYSVPGQVAVLKNDEGLMTDIFFGDMGGQIWRFVVNNGKTGNDLLSPGSAPHGIVASISGSDANNTRRFYQTPMLYKIPDTKLVSVNVGTGYKAHPLVKGNEDRFYSFRFPLEAVTQSSEVVNESMLGELDPMNIDDGPTKAEDGFMLKLDNVKGEKVISNAFADFDRLVFSTYIPDTGSITQENCAVNKVGTQRTYYFSLATGKSLLETGYTEVYPATLPLDSVAYCNDNVCNIISSMDMLSEKIRVPDASITDRNKDGVVQKTTWTDFFNPDAS